MNSRIRSLVVTIDYSMLFRILEVYYRDLMFKILRFSTALGDYNKRAKVPNPIFKEIVTYVQVCRVFRDVHFRRFGDLKTRFVDIECLS